MSKVILDVKGIILAPGELSRAPGSMTIANNVNVEAPGIIRSRQGVARQTNGVGGPGWKFVSTKELDTNLLYNYGTQTAAANLKYGDGSASWSTVSGTFTNQPATRMQVAVGRRNHYLTTDEAVRRLESSYGAFTAGMPKGLALDLSGPTVLSGAPGTVVADTESVAYRHTWCKKDVQDVPMEGAPSSRTIVYNNTRTSGFAGGVTKNVTCRIILPKQPQTASTALTTSFYWRLYRSPVAATGIVASDEMNLVAEAFLTSTNISNGYVDVTDSTPEAFRALGDALYTNEVSGGDVGPPGPDGTPITGIELANNPPPRARDVALFAECMFYADLLYPYSLDFTILSTVAGTGLTAADTITIDGVAYTAIAPGTPAANEFVVATVAAGSSLFEALERTAMNFVQCVNKSASNTTVWAYYASEPDKLPGKIRLESRLNGGASFGITPSAHGTAYRPDATSGVAALINENFNGYAYSKPNAPDAVPSVNVGRIGRDDTHLLRMVVLRDALYFFTDAGIYRLTGRSQDDFAVNEFDLTFRLRGREMVTVCDDHIYAWGYEGIAKISASGVEYISNAIEPLLWGAVRDVGSTWLGTYAWATSYRSRHKVLFAIPTLDTNVNCATVLVYDTRMEAWTTWSYKRDSDGGLTEGHSTGVVRVSDDLLFLGQWNAANGDSKMFKERLTYTAADYVDDLFSSSNQAITKTVTWNVVADSPEAETHWDELHLMYDVSTVFTAWTTPTAVTVRFTSDMASNGSTVTLAPTATSRFSRCLVTQAQRRSARLIVRAIHAVASEYFGLEGMVVVHLPGEGTATVRT